MSDEFIDVSKIDPSKILNPEPRDAQDRFQETEGMPHLEQHKEYKPKVPDFEKPPEKLTVENAPIEKSNEPTAKDLPLSLVDRLTARFGLKKEELTTRTVHGGSESITVGLRPVTYDAQLWALGTAERAVAEDWVSLAGTNLQTQTYVDHLMAGWCVVEIEGIPVWDVFQLKQAISDAIPGWDGKSYSSLPPSVWDSVALSTVSLLQSLHPDLLFNLSTAVEEIQESRVEKEKAEKPKGEEEDPPSAT